MCKHEFVSEGRNKVCRLCGKTVERYVSLEELSIGLVIEAKDEETKKYIQEVLKRQRKPKKYIHYFKNGSVFFKDTETGKIVDVMTVHAWEQKLEKVCERLAAEIRGGGAHANTAH